MSDNNNPQIKYDVFVSFRGKDIRDGFLSHLTRAFHTKQINAFVDDKLEKGEEIWPSLVAAIERSAISLIIFSPDYASSHWCLKEIAKIIECQEKYGRTVIPVFYKVTPTDVRHQSGRYQKAFAEHATKHETELQLWKRALDKSASFSGMESTKYQNDAEVVEVIVADVLKKLKRSGKFQVDSNGLVGIDDKIATLESWISNKSEDTRLIGIWGMGGIGKTTLAEVVFNRLRSQYDGSYFLANERDQSNKHDGTTPLRNVIFSKLIGEEVHIDTPNFLPEYIARKIGCMKVLVVLDDVNDSDHIKELLGSLHNFGMGSTVIVTTRDEQVLRVNNVSKTYIMTGFNSDEALEHFNMIAFKENVQERGEYNEISKLVVNYANGNPLVVKVLAHLLYGRNKEEWESLLSKLKNMPPKKVYDVMKLSYDSLDRIGQQIFLDLACFFVRLDKSVKVGDLKSLLKDNENDNSVAFELKRLEDKALITISKDNIVCMHDSLQEMGWEIVRQESIDDPGSRSRLWDPNDIYEALVNKKLSKAIRSIQLPLTPIKKQKLSAHQIFAMLRRAKFVEIFGTRANLPTSERRFRADGVKFMGTELRFLFWENYPLRSLPESLNAEKLVILIMNEGKLENLWDGVKNVVNLKKLDLSWSRMLKELPDLSRAKNLEELNVRGCVMLACVHSSIFSLRKLERLDLANCTSLTVLASNSHLLSLRYLNLICCDNLKKFSVISENLKELNFGGTKLKALPSSFGDQPKLESLCISETGIERLPSLNNLGQLVCLEICFCSKLQTIAEFPPLLKTLHVDLCHSLKTLPKLPPVLETLRLSCVSLESLREIPSSLLTLNLQASRLKTLPKLPLSLKTLIAHGCSFQCLVELPGSLETLDIQICRLLQTLPELPPDLKTLCVYRCTSLETLPKLPLSLEKLDVRYCSSLETLPKLPPSLETLHATHCKSLKTVLFPSLADEQLKENKKLVLFSDSVMLDERAIGFNAKINIMKFANQHLSAPNHNPVKNYGYRDAYTRSDRCVYMYPGNSFPEWLEYSTGKDCITIDLSSAPPSPELGFIFSFILDMSSITTNLQYPMINNLQCRITTFDGEDGGKSDSFRMPIPYGNLYVGSNYVCMIIYDQTCSEFLNTRAKNQTKFKIQVTMVHPSKNPHTTILIQQMLKRFGVSPISTSAYEAFIGQIELGDSKSEFH